jgi:hypothetical protein
MRSDGETDDPQWLARPQYPQEPAIGTTAQFVGAVVQRTLEVGKIKRGEAEFRYFG